MNGAHRGFWAGVFATSAMSVFMMRYFESLPRKEQSPLPPAMLTDDMEKATIGAQPKSPITRSFNALGAHFAYGVAASWLYAALAPRSKASFLVKGPLFAGALWGGSYLGWIPSVGFRPTAARLTNQRNVMMILGHVLWGLVLGYSEQALRTRGLDMWDGKPRRFGPREKNQANAYVLENRV